MQPIKRNSNGSAIIDIFNNKKEKVGECTIDDNIYYELLKYPLTFAKNGHVMFTKNNVKMRVDRFVMEFNRFLVNYNN